MSITEALDAVPIGRFMAGHVLTMVLALSTFAMVHEAPAYSLAGMKERLQTTDSDYARMSALFQIGAAIGNVIAFFLADLWGRRATAITSALLGAMFHFSVGAAGSMASLDLLRVAQAIFYAVCFTSMNTWYVEFLPTRRRGQFLSAIAIGWPVGRGMTIAVSGYFGGAFATWYLAGFALMCFAVLMLFQYESPRFLLLSCDHAQAHEVLGYMHSSCGGRWQEQVVLTMAGPDEESALLEKATKDSNVFSRVNTLFHDHARFVFFIMGVFALLASSTILLDTWGPVIYQRLFDTDAPQSIMMLFNISDLVGIIVSIGVADVVGRRGGFYVGFFLQAIFLAGTAQAARQFLQVARWFPMMLGCLASSCRAFAWEAASMWLVEVFPTHLRVTALASVLPVMRLFSVVTIGASGELVERASPDTTLVVIAAMYFLGGLFVACFFPLETANVPMSESRRWHAK